jgi:hypothetical protein
MRQLYTLEEIHRYQADLDAAEAKIELGHLPDYETNKHYQAQIHVMREVLLRMHESVEKHGPLRPGLLQRIFATREVSKSVDAPKQFDRGKTSSPPPPKKDAPQK